MRGRRVPIIYSAPQTRPATPPRPIRQRQPRTQAKLRAILTALSASTTRLTPAQLANRTGLARTTVSTYLGLLGGESMVYRVHGRLEAGDARYRMYGITDAGRSYLAETNGTPPQRQSSHPEPGR